MKRGDIFLVSLDPTFGHEQQGTRPVLIISSNEFLRVIRTPIIVPITTGGDFVRVAGYAVSLSGCGTSTVGVVRCDQPRSLDLLARKARRVEAVPDFILEEVLQKVASIFD